jgi:hypothetical protein
MSFEITKKTQMALNALCLSPFKHHNSPESDLTASNGARCCGLGAGLSRIMIKRWGTAVVKGLVVDDDDASAKVGSNQSRMANSWLTSYAFGGSENTESSNS